MYLVLHDTPPPGTRDLELTFDNAVIFLYQFRCACKHV